MYEPRPRPSSGSERATSASLGSGGAWRGGGRGGQTELIVVSRAGLRGERLAGGSRRASHAKKGEPSGAGFGPCESSSEKSLANMSKPTAAAMLTLSTARDSCRAVQSQRKRRWRGGEGGDSAGLREHLQSDAVAEARAPLVDAAAQRLLRIPAHGGSAGGDAEAQPRPEREAAEARRRVRKAHWRIAEEVKR